MKNTALVLSGGGAKGAFQFGALQYIEEEWKPAHPEFEYNVIAGVSVGALNGVMLAMGKYQELKKLWYSIKDNDVYNGSPVLRVLTLRKSFYSNQPLVKKIQQYISLNDIKPQFKDKLLLGSVSLVEGEYYSFKPSQFKSDEEFRKAGKSVV